MCNSLLNLKFSSRTKVIAFADDLIILTREACKNETEHYANQDLKKIERWATNNKTKCNDKNLGFCLYQGKETTTGKLIFT